MGASRAWHTQAVAQTLPCSRSAGVPSGKANTSHFSLQLLMDNMPEAHMQGQTVVTQIPAEETSEQALEM